MDKRTQHRQGIVRGPVRPTGRRDRGAIMGTLLGVLVVVGTVGVLGFGALMLLQGNVGAPLITPTPAAFASPPPDPSPLPSLGPTPGTSATPASTTSTPLESTSPTPGSTPPPTPFLPQVLIGPGYVTFGTEADAQLNITDPRPVFASGERMVWSAQLTQRADSPDLRIHVLKLDPEEPSGQRLIREDAVRPRVSDAQVFLRRVSVDAVTQGPGLYTVRYLLGETILSEGSFLLTEGS